MAHDAEATWHGRLLLVSAMEARARCVRAQAVMSKLPTTRSLLPCTSAESTSLRFHRPFRRQTTLLHCDHRLCSGNMLESDVQAQNPMLSPKRPLNRRSFKASRPHTNEMGWHSSSCIGVPSQSRVRGASVRVHLDSCRTRAGDVPLRQDCAETAEALGAAR